MATWSLIPLISQGKVGTVTLYSDESLRVDFNIEGRCYYVTKEEGITVTLKTEEPYNDNLIFLGYPLHKLEERWLSLMTVEKTLLPETVERVHGAESHLQFHLCQGCGDRFQYELCFVEHITRRVMCLIINCPYCLKKLVFGNTCALKFHLIIHDPKKSHEGTRVCMKVVPLSINEHGSGSNAMVQSLPRTISRVQRLKKCPQCFGLFPSLDAHLQGNSVPNTNYVCRLCSHISPTPCSHILHTKMHLQKPPFCCPECGSCFISYNHLRIHVVRKCFHESKSIKPYCKYCDLIFDNDKQLIRHVISEHSVIMYKCTVCGLFLNSYQDSVAHLKNAHNKLRGGVSAYSKCKFDPKCSGSLVLRTKFASHLERHVKSISTTTYVYTCKLCTLSTNHKMLFKEHMDKGHAQVSDAGSFVNDGFHNSIINSRLYNPNEINSQSLTNTGPVVNHSSHQSTSHESCKYSSNKFSQDRIFVFAQKDSSNVPYQSDLVEHHFNDSSSFEEVNCVDNVTVCGNENTTLSNGSESVIDLNNIENTNNSNNHHKNFETSSELKTALDNDDFKAIAGPLNSDHSMKEAINIGYENIEKKVNPLEIDLQLGINGGTITEGLENESEDENDYFCEVVEINEGSSLNPSEVEESLSNYTGMYKCLICNTLCEFWEDVQEHFSVSHSSNDDTFISSSVLVTRVKVEIKVEETSGNDGITTSPQKVCEEVNIKVEQEPSHTESTTTSRECDRQEAGSSRTISLTRESICLEPTSTGSNTTSTPTDREVGSSNTIPLTDESHLNNNSTIPFYLLPQTDLKCKYCKREAPNITEFRKHVMVHRPREDAFQCLECGSAFMSPNTLGMHLVIAHDITNTDEYMNTYDVCPLLKRRRLESKQCSVCKEVYDTEEDLKKHFRSHGMAFLSTIKPSS